MDTLSDILSHGMIGQLLDQLPDGVYVVDCDCRIVYWNAAAETLTGFAGQHVTGHWCRRALPAKIDHFGTVFCGEGCPARRAMSEGATRREHLFIQHMDGHRIAICMSAFPLRDEQGSIVGAVCVITDRPTEQAPPTPLLPGHTAADLDPVTELANNSRLLRHIEARIIDATLDSAAAAALFIEIDDFTAVVPVYGMAAGDYILRTIGQTLRSCCRQGDVVGRWDDSVFIALLHHDAISRMVAVAEQMRILVERSPIPVGSEDMSLTVTVAATPIKAHDSPAHVIDRGMSLLAAAAQSDNRVICDRDGDGQSDAAVA